MHRLHPILVGIVVTALVACTPPPERVEDTPPAPASPPSTPTEPTEAERPSVEPPRAIPALPTAELAPASDRFELIDAGTEPRSKLRFDPPAGALAEATLIMAMQVALSGSALPPMRQDLAPVDRKVVAELLEPSAEALRMRLDYAAGLGETEDTAALAQTLGFDPRGRVVEVSSSTPTTTSAQQRKTLDTVAQTLAQLLLEFPDAAVGVGGVWKATRPVTTGGLELEQTSQIRLVARDDQRLTFEVEITQAPRTTEFTPPGQSAALELVDFEGRGAATIVYELDSLLPAALRARLETKFSAATTTEPPQQLDFDLGVDLTLTRE